MTEFIKNYKKPPIHILLGIFSLLIIATIFFFALSRNSEPQPPKLVTTSLPELELGHYAIWEVDGNSKNLVQRFLYRGGKFVDVNLEPITYLTINDANNIFELSIEKDWDRNTEQSKCIYMTGKVENGQIKFIPFWKNIDLNKPPSFQLGSPTDGNTNQNEYSGIWFSSDVVNLKPTPISEPSGCWEWKAILNYYETPLSLGSFKRNDQQDSFNNFSSPLNPNIHLPGEDFYASIPNNIQGPLKVNNPSNTLWLGFNPASSELSVTNSESIFIPFYFYKFTGSEVEHRSINFQINEEFHEPNLTVNL